MTRALFASILLALLTTAALAAPECAQFSGRWDTTFGPMTLSQTGARVSGVYVMDGVPCKITGSVKDRRFTFRYREPGVAGEGWFELGADGKTFEGKWRPDGQAAWMPWTGRRPSGASTQTFDGLWNSTFGPMRLLQRKGRVDGIYAFGGTSTLEGSVRERSLVFTYREPSTGVTGEGTFELSRDGLSMAGKWREAGSKLWKSWEATRLLPKPGLTWLVVVEARWETGLADPEFSFGAMLDAFFARSQAVRVRRRIFNDEPDLKKWCRESAFLAEPVILCIASHGEKEGVQVGGKTIGAKAIAEGLRYAGNLRLLHFSSCLAMKDDLGPDVMKLAGNRFPVSGYTTSVEWAVSALIEFMYFDLIMLKNLTPAAAAKQIEILMPFSGKESLPDSAVASAGFEFRAPPPEAPQVR